MKSIKARMLSSILSVVMLIFTITIGFNALNSFKLLEGATLEYAGAETNKFIEMAQDEFVRGLSISSTAAKVFEGMLENTIDDRNELLPILKNIIEANPNLVGVWTVWEPNALDGKDAEYINAANHDETGRFIPYWNRGSGTLVLDKTGPTYKNNDGSGIWYTASRDSLEDVVSEPATYNLQGEPVMLVSITSPIVFNGKAVGVVGVDVSLNRIQDIISNLRMFETGYTQLISPNGTIVGHPEKDLVGKNTFEIFEEDDVKGVMESGRGISVQKKKTETLEKRYLVIEPFKVDKDGGNWIFMSVIPNSEIYRELDKSIVKTVATALIGLSILGIGILIITNSISSPIVELSHIIERISNFDLTFDNNSKAIAYLDRKDEIGSITNSLAQMQNNLIDLIREVAASSQNVAASSQELTANMDQSSRASDEVAKAISEIAGAASAQAQDTERAAYGIDLLGQGIMDNGRNTEELNQSTLAANTLGDLGLASIKELLDNTANMTSSVSDVYEIIQNTNQSSEKIKIASEMIKSIADQTNLLALNAAIEAARAGEAGRGFAVVADEIRKLAEESNTFSDEINSVISELTKDTEYAVKTMLKLGEIVESQNQSVNITNQQFQGISSAIETVEKSAVAIRNSSNEMETKKDEIMGVIENLSAIAEENAASTEEAAASVEEQAVSFEEVLLASESLAKLAEEMQRSIAKFKY